jgi:hypothetical protein
MVESPMTPEFEAVTARTAEIPRAFAQAHFLETQAKTLREDSVEAQALAFEAANENLIEKFNLGIFSSLQVVEVIAKLNDLDPEIVKLYDEKRGSRVIDAFEALKIGAPVLSPRTGIVIAEPEVTKITARKKSRSRNYGQPFMAPWGMVSIPLRVIDEDGEVEETTGSMEIMGLNPGYIGRAAIKAMVQQTKFRTMSDNTACHPSTITNTGAINSLKANVAKLHKLGMTPISTLPLELELIKARSFSARRSSIARRPRRRARN